MKKKLFLFFLFLVVLTGCAPDDLNTALKDVEQNTLSYLNPETENKPLMEPEKQKELTENYLKHYFSPWENENRPSGLISNFEKVKETQIKLIEGFKKKPGWAQNHQPHPIAWIEKIEKNMDINSFPNSRHRAITTEGVNLRLIPTRRPSFSSLKEAGQGFPFDNLQVSYLPANLPVLILHVTQDKAWSLVITHHSYGWVPSNQIAKVDDHFITQWKTGKYVTPAVLETPLKTSEGRFHFYLRLGHLYPAFNQQKKGFYTILIALKDLNNKAVIRQVTVEEKLMYEMPIPITPYHISLLANEIIGQAYGWGGLFGYRDCSSTLADLFAPFGIWLPRNSRDQSHTWKHISLEGMKNSEKKKLIETKGISLLTTIGWPGHIMLYLGTHNHQTYVFHTAWGLQTTLLSGKTGRAIFGKTIITPIHFGSEYMNIKATPLEKASVMTFLGEKHEKN